MSDFQKLLGELDTLAKALPADDGNGDEKIQAAAEEGGEVDKDKKVEGGDAAAAEDKGAMAKSFKVTLADGTEVEAEDGTELVKSLGARLDETEGSMAKALELTIGMLKGQSETIKAQGDLIKSLRSDFAKLGNQGAGRKTILSVVEKETSTMAKSEPQGMQPAEFMAKSHAAFDSGKITGLELNMIDASLRQRVAIDPALIARVVG